MTNATRTISAREIRAPSFVLCVGIVAAVTLVRLIGLRFSVVDLYFDESQYWAWAQVPAFGYFSKPPMIAWIIAVADHVCGNGEACIRSASPIFYFGTSLLFYALASTLYDRRVAFWAALTLVFTTSVVFSTRIISTDVPLFFFWTLALLAYVKLLQGADFRWAIVLGLALGLGLLAKYMMGCFVLSMIVAAYFDRAARDFLKTPAFWTALAIAAVLIAPNLLWNLDNGFATIRHTGDNIRGSGAIFSLRNGFKFLASQFVVFGPITFGFLIAIMVRSGKFALVRQDRLMLAFSLPVLAIVTALSFVTRAHANWTATAVVSSIIVVVAVLVRFEAWRWLKVGLGIGIVVQALLLVGDSIADRLSVPGLAKVDIYQPTMGWRALGEDASRLARQTDARTVATGRRDDVASLVYYLRNEKLAVLAWPESGTISDHFQLTRPLTATAREPILLITRCAAPLGLADFYASIEPLGPFQVRSGPTTVRNYYGFKLNGRNPVALSRIC
jgi:4-amino-4-deoxy-L-arabinose transferase-like glycosyltransferase